MKYLIKKLARFKQWILSIVIKRCSFSESELLTLSSSLNLYIKNLSLELENPENDELDNNILNNKRNKAIKLAVKIELF